MQELSIAIGRSRKTKVWKNQKITWESLVNKFRKTGRTLETYKEYCNFTKDKQADIKDNGGFVGGYLKDGHRSPGSVTFRQILTLDLDFAEKDFWDDFQTYFSCEAVLHTTHKHSPKSPRFRLIIPLAEQVSKEQYEAIGRKLASILDIELFDPTTFQPERLMYWPTTSRDGEYIFQHQEGNWLDPHKILARYVDWQDMSEWPIHADEMDFMKLGGKQAGEPTEKPGLIGAFCRTYDIHEAIAEFLPDVYEQTDDSDSRYTYKAGSGHNGAITFDNKFLYSYHGTDPATMKLLNAWDLVRIHKFGFEDTDSKETEISKQKSQKLMSDLATGIPDVVMQVGLKNLPELDFDVYTEEDYDWLKLLKVNKDGTYEETIDNFYIILRNDPLIKGRLRYNDFAHREALELPVPWRTGEGLSEFTDKDDSGLRHYLEQKYRLYHVSKSQDAMRKIFMDNTYHPVRDYLRSLTWDGKERIETLLINHLGAEDNAFNRAATRKAMVAAVARVFIPGCKYDYMPIIIGPQGVGKSKLLDKLGGEWFSDSFMGVEGTAAYEQLQGIWLMEVAELAGIKKADVEPVKHFIAKRIDRFRVAYGKRSESFARQVTFWGTSNEKRPLKDPTGGRRFWPIEVDGLGPLDVDDINRDQLWSEAKYYFDQGEALYLDAILEETARDVQANYTENDDREGMVANYLALLLPENWHEMDLYERRQFVQRDEDAEDGVQRLSTCSAEIWSELFRGEPKDMGNHNTKYIHHIMNNIADWERSKGQLTFPLYGKQRAYVRKGAKLVHSNKRRADRI